MEQKKIWHITDYQEYLQLFEIEMLDLIQDEDKVEVEMIMNQFGKKIK